MRVIARIAAIAAVAVAVLGSRTDAQAIRELTVPSVTVTAPAPPSEPPYLSGDPAKAFARNPYFGNDRVEENRFAPVPCTETRIASVAGGSCLWGYRLTAGLAYSKPNGDGPMNNRCDLALDVVSYNLTNLSIEASILIFDPYKLTATSSDMSNCYVYGFTGYNQRDFADMNQVTRRGTNWHDLRGAGDNKSIAFSDGPHDCMAVRRHGPPWLSGYVYMLTASICRTDTASLQPDDVARALAAVKIREYDPEGNLRPPPQQP